MDERGSPSPTRERKRLRSGEVSTETDDGDDFPVTNPLESLEDSLNFSDTLVALQIMKAQFPRIDKVALQPFVLRSQVYSSVSDRTQVDREIEVIVCFCGNFLEQMRRHGHISGLATFFLEFCCFSRHCQSLRRSKVLRVFKLNTGQDDHAIMFLDDYLKQIDRVVERMEEKKMPNLEVFQWFKLHVLDMRLEPNISHQDLVRQLIDPDMYWFAIPNVGSLLKGLNQGRKELLSLLSRRKYKEMLLAALEKKRLHLSPLDMRFHLRDLIGSGHLKTVNTPSGLVVRISKD